MMCGKFSSFSEIKFNIEIIDKGFSQGSEEKNIILCCVHQTRATQKKISSINSEEKPNY